MKGKMTPKGIDKLMHRYVRAGQWYNIDLCEVHRKTTAKVFAKDIKQAYAQALNMKPVLLFEDVIPFLIPTHSDD